MKPKEFFDKVAEMRSAQKEYFRTRSPQALSESKKLDRGMNYDWAGNNCPNKYQRNMIAQTYYLYREMLHKYTIANRHKNVYSSETLRCKDSGEPIKITWEE